MDAFDTIGRIITLTLFATTLRMTTPVLFATLGGVFSAHTGIFNVGLEGLMDLGAFFAIVGSVALGSPWAGLGFAVVACVITSFAFAAIHLELKANALIVGLALNLFAYGLTNYMLVPFSTPPATTRRPTSPASNQSTSRWSPASLSSETCSAVIRCWSI